MKTLNETLNEGTALVPPQIEAPAPEGKAHVEHEPADKAKARREAAKRVGIMGEMLAGAQYGDNVALDKAKALAMRVSEASGKLAEVGFAYVAWCGWRLTRDEPDLARELAKYDGKDASTLAWRQSIMWHLELVETNGQNANGDDKYKRTEECTQRIYAAFNNGLARIAPVILYALTKWPDLKLDEHDAPFAIKTFREDGANVPRLAVPRALIEPEETGTCVLDGQEKRTLQMARNNAREELGFGEKQREPHGKVNARNTKQETDMFKRAYKCLTVYFLNGMGEKKIRPFAKVPLHVRTFILQVTALADSAEAPAAKVLPWSVK